MRFHSLLARLLCAPGSLLLATSSAPWAQDSVPAPRDLGSDTWVAFDFHCVDNAPPGADIRGFWILGDSAPNGRFNYRFQNAS